MRQVPKRNLWLACTAIALLIAGGNDLRAQDTQQDAGDAQDAQASDDQAAPSDTGQDDATELPDVDVVQEPSPPVTTKKTVKKKKHKISKKAVQAKPPVADTTADDQKLETEPAPGTPGTLVVIDDAFASQTVATGQEVLASQGGNVADTLATRPGISSSTFAAGASRPIIRGLDNNRVRVQENGIGSGDVSELSEDHAVPIDPFAATQVKVIRGPETLRYGSQAFGGVVSVENGRIPTHMPVNGFSGELKGGWSSVDDSRNGAFKASAGANGIVVYADSFRRRADDYDTPAGKQLNTFAQADGEAVGASVVGREGFVGVALSRYSSLYGIPGEEAVDFMPSIDLEQNKILSRGEWRVGGLGIEAVRFWFGASEYAHNELVHEGSGDKIGSRFTNEEYETRVELQHMPLTTPLGGLHGTIGIQIVDRNLRGQSFEGDSLLETAKTNVVSGFWFEKLEVTRDLTFQAAARIEQNEVDGFARLDPLSADMPLSKMKKGFTPFSSSIGALYRLPAGTVLSVNGQYVQRAPAAAELFSKGAHEATGTFEIGNPNLEKERAKTIEIGLRKAKGALRFDATAYYTRFNGFIVKQLTGLRCDATIGTCGSGDEFDQIQFQQSNATFYGVELAAQYDIAPIWNGMWGIEGQYDFVNARLDGGENVPRIPPHRLGGGLYYHDANWSAKADVLHAFDQNRIGVNEIATPGYTLVSAELTYTTKLDKSAGFGPQLTIGLKGENLANEEVLNHASFKRRENVLLPGASVKFFGSVKLN